MSLTEIVDRELATRAIRRLNEKQTEKPRGYYKFRPFEWLDDKFGINVWGHDSYSSQWGMVKRYEECLKRQWEQYLFENELIEADQLQYFDPVRDVINPYIIAVSSGHNTGKSYIVSLLAIHFLYEFENSIIYAIAPGERSLKRTMLRYIKTHIAGREIEFPGQRMATELKVTENNFLSGIPIGAGGNTEKIHGTHPPFGMAILDESQKYTRNVFDAVESTLSGCKVRVLFSIRNPESASGHAHDIESASKSIRVSISCLDHPNIVHGREIIPGAVNRQYVLDIVENDCAIVKAHDDEKHTFELTWFKPGAIYLPGQLTKMRVLGIATDETADKSFVSRVTYKKALERKRPLVLQNKSNLRIGLDAARFGKDLIVGFQSYNGVLEPILEVREARQTDIYRMLRGHIIKMKEENPEIVDVQIRFDGTGGWASGVIDLFVTDADMQEMFERFNVYEVIFGSRPFEPKRFADNITEMYYWAGEALKTHCLVNVPKSLETDLCDRIFRWMRRFVGDEPRDIMQIMSKEEFRKWLVKVASEDRSPDYGDALVLATFPDNVFETELNKIPSQKEDIVWEEDYIISII